MSECPPRPTRKRNIWVLEHAFCFGWFIGNILSGPLYDTFSSKTQLAGRYLTEELGMSPAAFKALGDEKVVSTLAAS